MRTRLVKSFILTVLTLTITLLIGKLSETSFFRFIFPETIGLEEYDLTDVVLKERTDLSIAEEIIIVNIGQSNRRQIAEMIRILSAYNPRLIGIDGFFDCRSGLRDTINCPQLIDTLANRMLSDAIIEAGNVVLVSKLLQSKQLTDKNRKNPFDSLRRSDSIFRDHAVSEGYNNLDTDPSYSDDAKTCRTFNAQTEINGKRSYAFGVAIAMVYDSIKTNRFLDQVHDEAIINYRGNIVDPFSLPDDQAFYVLDVEDVFSENFVPEAVSDKIVIMGYLGERLGDPAFGDMFYTPFNRKLTGKTTADMFGVVIHANIVAMILNEDYIDQLSERSEFIFAVIACFIHILLLLYIHDRLSNWFDLFSIALIILQLVLYSYLRIFALQWYSFKLTLIFTLGSLTVASVTIGMFDGFYRAIVEKLSKKKIIEQPGQNPKTTIDNSSSIGIDNDAESHY